MWVDLPVLEFFKTLQFHGKGEPSDYVIASALIESHERLDLTLAKARGFTVKRFSVKQAAQLFSAAFKAKGALDMQLRSDLRCAAHPPDHPGHIICDCPICSQGADPAVLDGQCCAEAGESAGRTADGIVRPVEVCPSLQARRLQHACANRAGRTRGCSTAVLALLCTWSACAARASSFLISCTLQRRSAAMALPSL